MISCFVLLFEKIEMLFIDLIEYSDQTNKQTNERNGD